MFLQLRELIALEDVVGNTLLSSVAKDGKHLEFSRLLLSRAYASGDVGLYEAAARCFAAVATSHSEVDDFGIHFLSVFAIFEWSPQPSPNSSHVASDFFALGT